MMIPGSEDSKDRGFNERKWDKIWIIVKLTQMKGGWLYRQMKNAEEGENNREVWSGKK